MLCVNEGDEQVQNDHENLAVPIANGGASTKGSGAHPPTPTIGELFDAYWKGNKRLNIYDHSPHEIGDGLRNVYFFGVSSVAIQRDELAEALLKLANEANALSELGRPCLGNTNTSCLLTRITEAHAVLAKLKS